MSMCFKSSAFLISGSVVALSYKFYNERKEHMLWADQTEQAVKMLPSLKHAQLTKVRHVKSFLTHDEVNKVKQKIDEVKDECGQLSRDKNGNTNFESNPTWKTMYLHSSDKSFQNEVLSSLKKRLVDAAFAADREEGWNLTTQVSHQVNSRTIEFHEGTKGAGLIDANHFDGGSLITIDLMLSKPGVDFQGGRFSTNGQQLSFDEGDLLIFVSHKHHWVTEVTEGRRNVLVMELWDGHERTCAHRCLKRFGECRYSRYSAMWEVILNGLGDSI